MASTGFLRGLNAATRNIPGMIDASNQRKQQKQFAELVASGDTEGAMNFALQSGDPNMANFANQYGRQRMGDEAAAQEAQATARAAEQAQFTQSLYNLANTGDYEGLDRAIAMYGGTPEGQADLQKQFFLPGHRKMQGMSTVRDRDGNVRLAPVIHNEQLDSTGVMTTGGTADPGDTVPSWTLDQFKGALQPYMEGAGYEPPCACRADPARSGRRSRAL